jgi:transcriptional regulator with GAF, ATPase, and Fis domain
MTRMTGSPGVPGGSDDAFDPGDGSTVAHAAPDADGKRLRRAVVIEGPDAGREFDLAASVTARILLGTSEICALRLTDATVSRRHAAFELLGKRYRVTDLQSTNGTFVDGVRVVEAYVRGGEVVRCGSTALRLDVDAAGPAPLLPSAIRFGSTLGASVAMRRLYGLCERLAKSRLPIVVEGETGTGKEVLAESLYEASGTQGPFMVFDCTTISSSLVEAELFGHERGAFTGATASRSGVFEEADGGTLLIDEVGDLDLALQAKLLRAIDRGEVRRIGGQKWIKVNVRIIAATRRDLDKAVAAGRFRDDLYHRLAVARIELPPLRDRQGDVPLLARHFAKELGGDPDQVEAEIEARFADYNWPGNVRELRNAVARFIALGRDWGQLPSSGVQEGSSPAAPAEGDWIGSIVASGLPYPVARRRTVEEFERRYVARVLAAHDGNVTHAARASGLAVRYFRLVKARQPKG